MRVVIIDDSPSAIQSLSAMLSALPGCDILGFQDSALALHWCLDNPVDLVLVDYEMPAPNGLQFIQRLRAHSARAEVPVVMVTSCDQREVRHQALRLGATDFLSKPVDEAEFLARVRNLLKLHQSHLALSDRAQWLGREVRRATAALTEREREAILILSRAAEFRDPETAHHLERMAGYCRMIAAGQGMAQDMVDLIFTAAPMHDIGKIGIPDHILLKPGRLTAREEELMRHHAAFGADILSGSTAPLIQMAATIARSHHERFDGGGYPGKLAGEEIPLPGRIAAVADVFDALTSDRPYKKAWPLDQAREYVVEQRGGHFDPACVDAFLAHWPEVEELAARYRGAPVPSTQSDVMLAEARNFLFGECAG
ncbi:MAG: HD-GYP domain-containing protein [Bacteroidales bacterium]